MNWHAQFEAWQEVVWGVVLLLAGLGLEFAIDVWRERVIKKRRHYHVIKDNDANLTDFS